VGARAGVKKDGELSVAALLGKSTLQLSQLDVGGIESAFALERHPAAKRIQIFRVAPFIARLGEHAFDLGGQGITLGVALGRVQAW